MHISLLDCVAKKMKMADPVEEKLQVAYFQYIFLLYGTVGNKYVTSVL